MANHKNFFETVEEASMRLQGGVILYDGDPYEVGLISDHRKDGVFRIYMVPFGKRSRLPDAYYNTGVYGSNPVQAGPWMDTWMETDEGKKSDWIRKSMDSPYFNKFRPFPLGMCNSGTRASYMERHPQRRTQQALTSNSITDTPVLLGETQATPVRSGTWGSEAMSNMIKGVFPSPEECVKNMSDPEIANQSVGFHRDFAFVRGPLDLLFLAYKAKVIGLLPDRDLRRLQISKEVKQYKEVTEDLKVFNSVEVR